VCWQLPESEWGDHAVTRRMDWTAAIQRWAGTPQTAG
jgi:hypothetical protein